jgi:hypothetical protein
MIDIHAILVSELFLQPWQIANALAFYAEGGTVSCSTAG